MRTRPYLAASIRGVQPCHPLWSAMGAVSEVLLVRGLVRSTPMVRSRFNERRSVTTSSTLAPAARSCSTARTERESTASASSGYAVSSLSLGSGSGLVAHTSAPAPIEHATIISSGEANDFGRAPLSWGDRSISSRGETSTRPRISVASLFVVCIVINRTSSSFVTEGDTPPPRTSPAPGNRMTSGVSNATSLRPPLGEWFSSEFRVWSL